MDTLYNFQVIISAFILSEIKQKTSDNNGILRNFFEVRMLNHAFKPINSKGVVQKRPLKILVSSYSTDKRCYSINYTFSVWHFGWYSYFFQGSTP